MRRGARGGIVLCLLAQLAVVSCSPTAPDQVNAGLSGTYELTIESNCSALPPALRTRTYLVTIRNGVANLSGTFFRHSTHGLANRIGVSLGAGSVSLQIDFVHGSDHVGVFEEVTPGQYYGVIGSGHGSATDSKRPIMTGTLDATFAYGADLVRAGKHVRCNGNPNSGAFRFEPRPFAAPPGVAGSPIVTKIRVSGPASLAPGESSTYRAMATMSDGSETDVSSSVFWSFGSATSVFQHLGGGLVLGKEVGQNELNATASIPNTNSGVIGRMNIVVTPPGTVRVSGIVTSSIGLVNGASVVVTSGVSAGLSAVSDFEGRYAIFGIAGPGDLVVSKSGYTPVQLNVSGTEHQTLNVSLTPGALLNVAGTYTLTMDASPSCRMNLTPAARTRTYTATLTQNGTRVFVTLSGGQLVVNKFEARADPVDLQFTFFHYWEHYWNGFPFPELVDTLGGDPFRELVISGRANTQATPTGFAGPLDGEFLVFDRPIFCCPYLPWTAPWPIEICEAKDHGFSLVRTGSVNGQGR